MTEKSCDLNDKGNSCCSAPIQEETIDLSNHWDKAYSNSEQEKLGWYETDLSPTLNLISKTGLQKSAKILNAGAGSTTLIDKLLETGYTNLIATDLSEVALKQLDVRTEGNSIDFIVDDLTNPEKLLNIDPVDLWIDRAVLHFFVEEKEQDTYFDLLKNKIKSKGFVILAEFNLNGATRCSGLPVHRYSEEMLIEKIGPDFELIDSFNYNYLMPSGAERPYIYTLFRKI
jgi:SAM-dependent methyltransferase